MVNYLVHIKIRLFSERYSKRLRHSENNENNLKELSLGSDWEQKVIGKNGPGTRLPKHSNF